jgi:hypothetical protein
MSGKDYLRNKLASSQQLIYVRKPTDASMVTQKKRFVASSQFLLSGGKGSLRPATDGANLVNTIVGSSSKVTGVGADASVFTAYKGSQAIRNDAPYLAGGYKSPPCLGTSVNILNFNNASSHTSLIRNCPINRGESETPSVFVDNTIRLSSGVPSLFIQPTSTQKTPLQCLTSAYHGPKNIACFYRPFTDFTRNTNKPWIGTPYVDGMLPFNTTSLKLGGPTPWTKFNVLNATPEHHGNPSIGRKFPYAGRKLNWDAYGGYVAAKINRATLFNIKG